MHVRPRTRILTALFLVLAGGAVSSCTPSVARPRVVAAPPDAGQLALGRERSNRLEGPVRVVFQWSLEEPGLRLRGRGVARMEPPYRARLDLFMANGETVLRAAMLEDDLRLPAGMSTSLLPPPALFWSAMGIFRPGRGLEMVGADADSGGRLRLQYQLASGQELRYRVRERAVEEVELLRGGQALERVVLTASTTGGFPTETVYRHLGEFRELKLNLESVDSVDPFPSDIWEPGR